MKKIVRLKYRYSEEDFYRLVYSVEKEGDVDSYYCFMSEGPGDIRLYSMTPPTGVSDPEPLTTAEAVTPIEVEFPPYDSELTQLVKAEIDTNKNLIGVMPKDLKNES